MEKRSILIANSKDQSKYRIVTDATTLGELQDAIARNEEVYKMVGQSWVKNTSPINISGLTFTEGITKTQLLGRDSALPTNVMFKGQPTNDLVMLLTNTNKQIRSGAAKFDRKALYADVKKYHLEEAIKTKFGKNFTMVGNADLDAMISEVKGSNGAAKTDSKKAAIDEVRKDFAEGKQKSVNKPEEKKEEEAAKAPERKLPDVKSAPHAETVEWFFDGIKRMVKENLLHSKDVVVLADLTTDLALRMEEAKPEISASDMDDMMRSIRH